MASTRRTDHTGHGALVLPVAAMGATTSAPWGMSPA